MPIFRALFQLVTLVLRPASAKERAFYGFRNGGISKPVVMARARARMTLLRQEVDCTFD